MWFAVATFLFEDKGQGTIEVCRTAPELWPCKTPPTVQLLEVIEEVEVKSTPSSVSRRTQFLSPGRMSPEKVTQENHKHTCKVHATHPQLYFGQQTVSHPSKRLAQCRGNLLSGVPRPPQEPVVT